MHDWFPLKKNGVSWEQAAVELALLAEGSALAKMLADYAVMREQGKKEARRAAPG